MSNLEELALELVKSTPGLPSVPWAELPMRSDPSELHGVSARLLNRSLVGRISGLPGREMFLLEQELWEQRAQGSKLAFVLVRLGAEVDELRSNVQVALYEWTVYQTGLRLAHCLPEGSGIYHLRQVEFLVCLAYRDGRDLGEVLRRLHKATTEPLTVAAGPRLDDTRMGVALMPRHGGVAQDVLRRANLALAWAARKEAPFWIYNSRIQDEHDHRRWLHTEISATLCRRGPGRSSRFELWFQPILQVDGKNPDLDFVALRAEVLLRWNHGSLGVLSPASFLAVAEATGLIHPLGRWVIYQFARLRSRRLNDPAFEHVSFSLNFSANQLMNGDTVASLISLAHQGKLDAQRVTVELTESASFANETRLRRHLEALSNSGYHISHDDFGTGFSTLANLERFPVDELKIDHSFVRRFPESKVHAALVKALLTLGSAMDIRVITEGVETEEQLEALRAVGCEWFQGYLFSEPLPEAEFLAFVRNLSAELSLLPKKGDPE